jgi:isopentenyl-diphosphate delta-isomerase
MAAFDAIELTFTPWFKLIARDFLFGWWDALMASPRTADGLLDARCDAIRALEDDKVWKM